MGSFSIWHWIIVLIYLVVFVLPCWRIVSKAGYSGAWSLISLVPLLNIVALWVFALIKWPYEKQST
jgi:hypothetical protein